MIQDGGARAVDAVPVAVVKIQHLPGVAVGQVFRLNAEQVHGRNVCFIAIKRGGDDVNVAIRAHLPRQHLVHATLASSMLHGGVVEAIRLPGLALVRRLPKLRNLGVVQPAGTHRLQVQRSVDIDNVRRNHGEVAVAQVPKGLLDALALVQRALNIHVVILVALGHDTDRAHPLALANTCATEGVAEDHGELALIINRRHDAQITRAETHVLRVGTQDVTEHLHGHVRLNLAWSSDALWVRAASKTLVKVAQGLTFVLGLLCSNFSVFSRWAAVHRNLGFQRFVLGRHLLGLSVRRSGCGQGERGDGCCAHEGAGRGVAEHETRFLDSEIRYNLQGSCKDSDSNKHITKRRAETVRNCPVF